MRVDELPDDQTLEGDSSNTMDEGQQDTGSTTPETGGASGGQDSGSQPTFSNPMLQGKTPAEIEAMFRAMNETIQTQNTELNQFQSRLPQNQDRAKGPGEQEQLPEYGDNFVSPELKTLESRLAKRMEQMVAPLQQDFQTQKAQSTREQARGNLRHFNVLEPTIDQILRNQGVNPLIASAQQLEQVYYTAVGLANERGINLSQATAESQGQQQPSNAPNNNANQMAIPQRRPSSSPLPSGQQAKKPQLTEDQRRMARFNGMTDEDYLKELNTPDDEVVTPGFSKDNW